MGRVNLVKKSWSVAFIFFILLGVMPALASAQQGADKKDNRPERGIAVYTEYSGVSVARGETVQMDLTLENKGRRDENIDVRIVSAAKGWKATLKGARYQVTGMVVTDGKAKNLALNLEPEKGIGPGKYAFQFEAKTADGQLTSSHTLTVNVQERTLGADNIQIIAAYPVLRGQTDSRFEFSLDVTNKGAEMITMLAIRVVLLDESGAPVRSASTYAATPATIENEWRGPILPGSTRHCGITVYDCPANVKLETEITDLRVWNGEVDPSVAARNRTNAEAVPPI